MSGQHLFPQGTGRTKKIRSFLRSRALNIRLESYEKMTSIKNNERKKSPLA
jgi:hypothetical protein